MSASYHLMCLTAALATVTVAQAEGPITITSGLVSYQTLQCNDAGVAAIALGGAVDPAQTGAVEARIAGRGGATVRDWAPCARPQADQWSARFEDVPAGGPYTVEVRVLGEADKAAASASVDHILVGDLWLLAGQSNMQGVGNNANVEAPSDQVNVFAMNDAWRRAEEPLHRLDESVDIVHSGVEDPEERQHLVPDMSRWTKGAGLGLPFAKEMVRLTGRPIGLLACAHGGTSMAQWDPSLRDQGGSSLYGSMYRRFVAVGGKVRGVLWYQGESDANADAGPVFLDKFKTFVDAVRRDFNAPELPFYYVQIGRFTIAGDPTHWNRVQEDQRLAETQIAHSAMVPSINLALDDGIHIGTDGLKTLGRCFAQIAARDLFRASSVQNGPRPVSIRRNGTPFGLQLLVTFSGVNGCLTSEGRVAGFSLANAEGQPVPLIYDQEASPEDPNTVILWVPEAPTGTQLYYGRGFDPYCNLQDRAGMAVPVFGPMPVPEK